MKWMTSETQFHDCPVQGCSRRVPELFLMCRTHWALVPPDVKERVYDQDMTQARRAQVRRDAVALVEAKLREISSPHEDPQRRVRNGRAGA